VIRAIDAFRTFDIVWTLTGAARALDRAVQPLRVPLRVPEPRLRQGSAAAMIGAAIILVVGLGLFRTLDRLMEVSK